MRFCLGSQPVLTFCRSVPMACRFGTSNANLLGVCEEGGFVSIFRTGEEQQRELLTPVRRWQAHRDAIFDVCWIMQDRRMLSGSGDYHICHWDTETMGLLATFRGHTGSIKSLKCHHDDYDIFASAGRDGNVLLWDVRVPDRSNDFGVAVKAPVMSLQGAHTLRKSSGRRTPTPGGGPGGGAAGGGEAKSVTGLLFALDDTILVSSGADGRIKYWDVRKVSYHNPAGVRNDPKHVVAFDVKPPQQLPAPDNEAMFGAAPRHATRPHGITCIALSPFGNRLAAYSLDNHIYEYDFYAPEDEAAVRRFDAPVSSFYAKAAYAPSGTHIAAGSSSTHVSVYDAHSPDARTVAGAEPMARLAGHSQSVLSVDWSPFDNQICSCSDDGTTRLWSMDPSRPQMKKRRVAVEDIDATDPLLPEANGGVAAAAAVAPGGEAPLIAPPPSAPVAVARRGPQQARITSFFK